MPTHIISAHDTQYSIACEEGSLINQRIEETGGRPYEDWLLEHIWEQHYEGTAVDVGAHIGNHTLWFTLICHLDVVAFEPIFSYQLIRNIALNSGNPRAYRVRAEPTALGAVDGRATDGGQRVLTAAGAPRGPGTAEGKLAVGEGPIEVRTLDSYELEGPIALIKVDVEGMEPAVLTGGEETIRRELPAIYAESPDGAASHRLGAVLKPWGYRRTGRFKRGTPIDKWEAK